MYTAEPAVNGEGGIDNLHQRFREEEVAIFEKHGAEIVAVWQRLDDPNTLVWMLAYRDRAHRQEVWAAFAADPAWHDRRHIGHSRDAGRTFPESLDAHRHHLRSTEGRRWAAVVVDR